MWKFAPAEKISRYHRLALMLAVITLAICAAANRGLADDPPGDSSSPELHESESSEEQQRTAIIALYLLIVLTVGAVSSLILMLLWGARVRRQARKPLPATSPNDPLWYLKKSKSPTRESEAPPGAADEETGAKDSNED